MNEQFVHMHTENVKKSTDRSVSIVEDRNRSNFMQFDICPTATDIRSK